MDDASSISSTPNPRRNLICYASLKSYFNATMGWCKQLCLLSIILSAVYVSCQELRSTLREENRTCPGDEVIFTCTVRVTSSLKVLNLAWSSAEYIGQSGSLQLSTADGLNHFETSTIDRRVTATVTAIVKDNTDVTRVLALESTLHITAAVASTVTCISGADGGTESIKFSVSAVSGIPRMISAAEILRPLDNICIILVTWSPPANSDPSDVDQYIVYVPSRNIRDDISSSTLITLTVPNCGDDVRIQVAAVNRIGCVGMNSSEVLPVPLDIPTTPATTEGGSNATTEGGSASASISSLPDQLSAGTAAGITFAVTFMVIVCICILSGVIIVYIYCHFNKKIQNLTLESHRQSDELKEVD